MTANFSCEPAVSAELSPQDAMVAGGLVRTTLVVSPKGPAGTFDATSE